MGLFGSTATSGRKTLFDKHADKSRAKAEKRGILAGDPLLVIAGFVDGHETFLILYPDAVELHTGKKLGAFTMDGSGIVTIPLANISSVGVESDKIWSHLKFTGSGVDEDFRIPGGEIVSNTRRRILDARSAAVAAL